MEMRCAHSDGDSDDECEVETKTRVPCARRQTTGAHTREKMVNMHAIGVFVAPVHDHFMLAYASPVYTVEWAKILYGDFNKLTESGESAPGRSVGSVILVFLDCRRSFLRWCIGASIGARARVCLRVHVIYLHTFASITHDRAQNGCPMKCARPCVRAHTNKRALVNDFYIEIKFAQFMTAACAGQRRHVGFICNLVSSDSFLRLIDSIMGSASEDEDDDEPHMRGQLAGLGSMGPNGPDSVGPMGPSDLSVQSLSTDSKTTHDDSDQVCIL